jgi:ABC-type Mn2+/Zn2+ transport system permease subunit
MTWLLAPLSHGFMLEALAVGTLVAVTCALLSCFIVLKGWSLMGDAISHAILPGVVLAWLIGLPLAVGAFAAGLVCAIGSGMVKAHSRVKEDTAMGVVFTGMFALGLVMISQITSDLHLSHILFGNILGIEREDLFQTLAIGTVSLVLVGVLWRDLQLFCFDPGHARSIGINVGRLRLILLVVLSGAIVAGVQAVGVILVVALLITPGCIGYLLTDRFSRMTAIAMGSAAFSNVVGIFISYHANASTAGSIVLVLSGLFVVALVLAPRHGLLALGRARRRALAPDR